LNEKEKIELSDSEPKNEEVKFNPIEIGDDGIITLRQRFNSSVKISLHGATLLSWNLFGTEMIFLSSKAKIGVADKAIRGGIPIVFPQFGPGPLKQHGFARLLKWSVVGQNVDTQNGDVSIALSLDANEQTRKVWDYSFNLLYSVVLRAKTLHCKLAVKNTDKKSFSFTALLHTYFPVDDISKTRIHGLQGATYIDKVDPGEKKEQDSKLQIKGEVDRVYKDVKNEIHIGDGGNAEVVVSKTGFKDIVVWNPWKEKAKGMDDMGDDEYAKMVCVEAGSVATPIVLQAGERWEGGQVLSVTFSKKTS